MNTFEINHIFDKKNSVKICCLECDEEFSTELDTNYSTELLPFYNDETLYCIDCEKPYDYTIKIDIDKIQITFKDKNILGKLEYSKQNDNEILNETTLSSVKKFYYLEIERLKKLLEIDTNEHIVNQSLNRLIFSGVITNVEIYLNETFKLIVFHSSYTQQKFVEEYEPYKKEQISLNEIFAKHIQISNRINEDLDNILYHNIGKVIKLFNIFNFELDKCPSIKPIAKHIQKRHNLVHRIGLDKYNNFQGLKIEEINNLIKDTNTFIDYIDKKIENKCYYQFFDDLESAF